MNKESYLRSRSGRCEKTLAAAGYVAPRFWELAKKSIGGRVRRNSLSHKKVSSKEIFPFLNCAKFYTSESEAGPTLVKLPAFKPGSHDNIRISIRQNKRQNKGMK